MSQLAKILPITLLALATLSSCSSPASSNPISHEKVIDAMSSDCVAINDPSGSDFDWGAIQTNEMLEECLLKIAKSIASIEGMVIWLSEQGFTVSESYRSSINNRRVIWAEWVPREDRVMPFNPRWSFARRWFFRWYPYAVSIEYEDEIPWRVIAQHQTK